MESEAALTVVTTPKREAPNAEGSEGLMTLPMTPGIQFVTTQEGLEQLLRLAPSHIDSAMARLENEERNERGSSSELPATHEPSMTRGRLSQIVSSAIRTLRRDAHGEVGGNGAVEVGEDRYRRMKAGFTQLKDHMTQVDEHRKQLQHALDRLHTDTMALQQTWPFLVKSDTNTTDVAASLSESCAKIEGLKDSLEKVVANQTSRKLAELQLFEEKLKVREQLRHQANVTEKRLQTLRASLLRSRGYHRQLKSKLTDIMREIAAKRQEFLRLRRRLAVMTEALEHVFQFYSQLDQCIAEPELETVHAQLQSFFELNQNIFRAIQPDALAF